MMDEFVNKDEKTYIVEADMIEDKDENDLDISNVSDEEDNSPETPKPIEVVNGNGNDLDISDVSEYLEVQKPKDENIKGNIIIPEEKK